MVHLINDVEIISGITQEKYIIQTGQVKFNLLKELAFLKRELNDKNNEFINIKLENKSLVFLCRTADRIKYNNSTPYIFDFYTLLNNRFVGHCIINDTFIESDIDNSYGKVTELNIRTSRSTKLMIKKLTI